MMPVYFIPPGGSHQAAKGLTAMPFVPTPDTALAIISYLSNDGVTAQNRLYCGSTDPITTADLTEITEALFDAFNANWTAIASDQWAITGIRARALNEEEGLQHVDTNTYPIAGASDDPAEMPSQVSYTVTLDSGLTGRSARGRVYGVGLPVSFQDGVKLLTTAQSLMQSKWTLIRTAMETAGHALQIVSFVDDGVPRSAGRPLPVVSTNVRFPLATQRRRLS